MAVPSNRSPSPLSSRSISQSRNLNSNSATRRSFSGNPFSRPSALTNPRNLNPITPANSPAGFGRRNSVGNLQGCDEKENEKDQILKPVKAARSPANGSKSFMSPTISAASKFTPSPRKKVLAERNDPVRTSITLSEGKATFFSSISSEIMEDLDQQKGSEGTMESTVPNLDQKDAVFDGPRVSKTSKRVTFFEEPLDSEIATELKPETVTTSAEDCVGVAVDSGSNNTPSRFPESPILAPLDADPSLHPYDPKTNFLSPRPQFLHYRPNHRFEALNKEMGLELEETKRLEDAFMFEVLSENFSDTDVTEGSSYEESQKGSEDSSLAENVPSEEISESIASFINDMSEGIVEEKEAGKTIIEPINHDISEGIFEKTEEKTIGESIIIQDMPEGVECNIGISKPRSLKILKFVSLLLVLFISCVSICVVHSPVMDTTMLDILKSSNLPEASEIALVTKANFNQLRARFKELSFDSISHLSLLINNLGKGDNLVRVQFMNLTDLQDDMSVCSFLNGHQQIRAFTKDVEEEEDSETEPFEEQTYTGLDFDDINEGELEEASELGTAELASEDDLTYTELDFDDINERELEVVSELGAAELAYEDDLAPLPVAPDVIFEEKVYETHPEVIENEKFEVGMDHHDSVARVESSSADMDPGSTTDADHHSIANDIISEKKKSPFGGSAFSFWGIASLVLALVSAAASSVVVWKWNMSRNSNVAVHTDGLFSKRMNSVSTMPEKMFQYRPTSQNKATKVDVVDDVAEEFCSSEMSSFQRSSSYSRKDLRGANEVQSEERMARKYSKRESLASSSEFSTGSPSYGSFTTYERISGKHANGDDEIMTPVRRSSRIRNQVTSP